MTELESFEVYGECNNECVNFAKNCVIKWHINGGVCPYKTRVRQISKTEAEA